MKKLDSWDALSGFYQAVDQIDAPLSVGHRRVKTSLYGPRKELCRGLIACGVGFTVALVIAIPLPVRQTKMPNGAGTWQLQEQLVRSGVDMPATVPDNRRTEHEGIILCVVSVF